MIILYAFTFWGLNLRFLTTKKTKGLDLLRSDWMVVVFIDHRNNVYKGGANYYILMVGIRCIVHMKTRYLH